MTQRICGIAFLGLVVSLSFSNASAWGQPRIQLQIGGNIQIGNGGVVNQVANDDADIDAANIDGVFLPPDRTAKRRLETGKELIQDKRYGEAVRLLGSLLESSEDFFFRPDPKQQVYRSLKAEAARLLAEMPSEGLESYELQFGAKARRMLEEALERHDLNALAEVSRRFFFTQAGAEATLLLGRHYWDDGRPLAAALCLNRLMGRAEQNRFEPMLSLLLASSWQQGGELDRSREVLIALKSGRRGEIRIGDTQVPLFTTDSQAIDWLRRYLGGVTPAVASSDGQWRMYRGDARRNALSEGDLPLLNPRWRVRCADHPRVAEAIAQLRRLYLDQNVPVIPSSQPVAIDNTLVMRTTRTLLAIDFTTGKRIWEARSPADDSLDQLLANSGDRSQLGLPADLVSAIDRRVWNDAPFGMLSSDGQRVYSVEDLGFGAATGQNTRTVVVFNGQRRVVGADAKDTNRLAALELKTEGKLAWEVGGPDGEDEPELAGAFFLGPPLPVMGRLYAIAETKGQEIRLVALSAETGKLDWSQQLAVVEEGILSDPFRRSAGATPSFADGILVCPTSAGAVVAVDIATRSLLWGYQYPRGGEDDMRRTQLFRARMFNQAERQDADAWSDATVTIADGRVLITPVEANSLYCVRLVDGELLWKQDRGKNLYVAGVHNGNVILVGRQSMQAIKLADGETAWSAPVTFPAGAMPSGRGFMTSSSYFVPLSSAEVVQVDLAKGEIVGRSRSRRGSVPGNLICFRGEVVSQGVEYLETFFQLDALKEQVANRLKENRNDPEALVRSGEINFDAGNLETAIADFRAAYRLTPDDVIVRELLVESLLAGLAADFKHYRDVIPEVKQLIVHDRHRLQFLRLLGAGAIQLGDYAAALEAYLELADIPPIDRAVAEANAAVPGLDEVEYGQWVQREVWLRAQIEKLRASASDEQRQPIDATLAAKFNAIATEASSEDLRRWIQIGGTHPAVDDLIEKLLVRLGGPESLLEREHLLERLAQSSDTTRRAAAMWRLVKLYDEAKRPEAAAIVYRKLASQWPTTVVADGKTPSELLASQVDESVRDRLAEPETWPMGLVEAKDELPQQAARRRALPGNRYQRAFDIPFHGDPGPFFANCAVTLDPRQQSLTLNNGLGQERLRLALGELNTRNRNFMGFNNPYFNSVSTNGHLMMYAAGFQIMAFDTLRPPVTPAKPLWVCDLSESLGGMPMNMGIHQRMVNVAWGENRMIAQDANGRPFGQSGPVTKHGFIVQRHREVLCLDPLTGSVRWQRRNTPAGCELFGDDEVTIAAPVEGGEGLVLSSADGALLGKCNIPPLEQRMGNIGRKLLVWRVDGGRSTVSLFDPWSNDTTWTHQFAANSKASIVGQEVLGVMEPDGKFVLLKLPSGEELASNQLTAEPQLTGIYLLPSDGAYLLITNTPPRNVDPRVPIQPAPGGMNNPLINGRMYALSNKTGAPLWERPLRIQNHGLVLSHPTELPLMFFMRSMHRNQRGTHQMRALIMAVDKRNGRVVYSNDDLQMNISNVEFEGDRGTATITAMFPGKTLEFICTDKPLPSPEEEQAEAKKSDGPKGVNGAMIELFRSINDAARKISGLPDPLPPFEADSTEPQKDLEQPVPELDDESIPQPEAVEEE